MDIQEKKLEEAQEEVLFSYDPIDVIDYQVKSLLEEDPEYFWEGSGENIVEKNDEINSIFQDSDSAGEFFQRIKDEGLEDELEEITRDWFANDPYFSSVEWENIQYFFDEEMFPKYIEDKLFVSNKYPEEFVEFSTAEEFWDYINSGHGFETLKIEKLSDGSISLGNTDRYTYGYEFTPVNHGDRIGNTYTLLEKDMVYRGSDDPIYEVRVDSFDGLMDDSTIDYIGEITKVLASPEDYDELSEVGDKVAISFDPNWEIQEVTEL